MLPEMDTSLSSQNAGTAKDTVQQSVEAKVTVLVSTLDGKGSFAVQTSPRHHDCQGSLHTHHYFVQHSRTTYSLKGLKGELTHKTHVTDRSPQARAPKPRTKVGNLCGLAWHSKFGRREITTPERLSAPPRPATLRQTSPPFDDRNTVKMVSECPENELCAMESVC